MKTSELNGAALDWAVAKCEGRNFGVVDGRLDDDCPDYSTHWAQGGAIIERERISVWARGNEWAAETFIPNHEGSEETGATPLIAAMRCYVASILGDEVQIPEEIQNGQT